MRCLVVGSGSIGKRHINNLLDNNVETAVFSSGASNEVSIDSRITLHTKDWSDALNFCPDVVIIANPTSLHVSTIEKLVDENVFIFVEKPLGNDLEEVRALLTDDADLLVRVAVGYNFRFHSAIQFLKKSLEDNLIGQITYVKCQVGQYLPDWHPEEDYKNSYVARADLGGGVLRTLSHEIDYVDFLLDKSIKDISCVTSNVSDLEIDVEDTANVLIRYENTIAEIHMDMVRKIPVRELDIYGEEGYLKWNDMDNSILLRTKSDEQIVWSSKRNERDASFKEELKVLLNSVKLGKTNAQFGDPVRTMNIISKCLMSAQQNRVISWRD